MIRDGVKAVLFVRTVYMLPEVLVILNGADGLRTDPAVDSCETDLVSDRTEEGARMVEMGLVNQEVKPYLIFVSD